MSDKIWVRTSFHTAFKCGGWAYVRVRSGEVAGQAGGERYASPQRMALTGLLAALKGQPHGPVSILIDAADVARTAALIAAGRPPQGEAAPDQDLELWAALSSALAGLSPSFAIAAPAPSGPGGFAAAWAELARDKANAQGAFVSAIPKPNLAKVPGLLL